MGKRRALFCQRDKFGAVHVAQKARPSVEDDNERTGDLLYRQMAEYSADHIPEEEPCSTRDGPDGMERNPGEGSGEHRSPGTSCLGAESALPHELLKPHSNRPKSKEHKRLNTHRLVLQYIAPCMNSYGLCIVDNFLGEKLGDRILQEVRRVHEDGSTQDGQLACQTLGQTKAIRGDKIAWVQGTETGCTNIGVLLARIDKLITFADGKLGSYKIRGRHKVSAVLCGEHKF
ncbi:hypothetical protein QTP70_010521 [Hemibagrus guttatus]|uniref:Uncharacterized protein n=1 Tax=Hemibagrus guttatus TaxID=175788 RepID=A0AAE0R0Q2_9TELE|nr:hypothetical protein QTP70_010521 [Hemibagrus guttatus]